MVSLREPLAPLGSRLSSYGDDGAPGSMSGNGSSLLPDIPGLGGALAGLVGGAAMTIIGAMLASSGGNDVWLESRQIGSCSCMRFIPERRLTSLIAKYMSQELAGMLLALTLRLLRG